MKVAGIIVEYNPFHQGHVYHLEQTKKLLQPDILVVLVSSWFSQRGLPSLLSPYDKTKLALDYGADLVIELPSVYAAQSADHFARYAMEALKQAGVNVVCFGSETNQIEELKKYATALKDIKPNSSLSQMRNISNILGELGSNDILGVQYIAAAQKLGIETICIQRKQTFKSATKTRNDFFNNLPQWNDHLFLKEQSWNSYYPYLRSTLLLTDPQRLAQFFLVNEGIENRLIQAALQCTTWESFLNCCVSKGYSRARIQRTCLFILLQIQKSEMAKHNHFNSVIVLGASSIGRTWLKTLKKTAEKKEVESNIYSRFQELPPFLQHVHTQSIRLYELVLPSSIEKKPMMR